MRAAELGVPLAALETDDPPVLYLAHDDESVSLSPSLTRFFATWEGLRDIGPEIWLLEAFRDADGQLNGEGERAEELQALLGRVLERHH